MPPEYAHDFSEAENDAFADLICEGFTHKEIERLEALADKGITVLEDGKTLFYKGFNPDVEDYTPGVDD